MDDCHSKDRNGVRQKTKTKSIIPLLESPGYKRAPLKAFSYGSVLITRSVIMAKYGMLLCRANYSAGTGEKNCDICGSLDDETHRINYCITYRNVNLYDRSEKLDFEKIHSNNMDDIIKVIDVVLKIWDLGTEKNCM